ncbi:hypothetical protein PSTG_04528 [Puccinia striiformis f. sp. tritici PST-78]|uniref:Uncharacterized protein n=2 Tax=Puccinia striiformis TaxID=27350 RepID=A0A0L0VTI7_9BASI|nr:hypothetical protein PSTG_04528 [Puccinia striiformis f. sp. tritici PST-78]
MACIVFNDVIVLFLGAVMHSFCSAGALGVAQGLVDYWRRGLIQACHCGGRLQEDLGKPPDNMLKKSISIAPEFIPDGPAVTAILWPVHTPFSAG